MKRSTFLRLQLALALSASLPARAQEYPSKPIKIIVPFPPGAGTDTLARQLAAILQEKFGRPVLVENRPGAGGIIGAEAVFKAAPDGYTIMFTPQEPLVTAKMLHPQAAFEPEAFVPIAVFARSTVVLMVRSTLPVENLKQLLDYANANPGKLNYASAGVGSSSEFTAELFKVMSGTRITEVPYQGASPAMNAMQAGQVDILFDAKFNAMPAARAGKVRLLAVADEKRDPRLPDLPAIAEVLPGFVSTLWTGLVAPPRTPEAIASKLSANVAEALKHPDLVERLADLAVAIGSTPAEMRQLMKEERERWANVIKTTGMKIE